MILRRVEVGELDIVRVAVVSVAGAASSAHVHSEAATPLVGPYVLGNVLHSDVAVGLVRSFNVTYYRLHMRRVITTQLGRAESPGSCREVRATVVKHVHETFRRSFESHGLRLRRSFSIERLYLGPRGDFRYLSFDLTSFSLSFRDLLALALLYRL